MAIFKRGKTSAPSATGTNLSIILGEGEDMMQQAGQAHRERWGLGSADSWNLDQTTGVIRWSFPDKVVEAPAQLLGSYNPTAGSWLWAWANQGLLPSMREDAERVRAWAEANGHTSLTSGKVKADAELAATMAAIAFRVSKATGFYRAPAGATDVFVTFGPVTITDGAGASTTFAVAVED